MSGRSIVAALSAWALLLPTLAHAEALELTVSIGDGPLFTGLKDLENQTGVELLYDGNVVREFHSPPVAGKLTTEAALQQMLSESDLTVRRAASGAWIIERRTTAPLAQQDAAVAEILVVGRRTQNADIRRSEDDVQPYTVATREEIVRAHRDNIDQYIATRVTANTTALPFGALGADLMSSIDLRGLGATDTVVLVDGRRMPSIPNSVRGFRQSDLNAIPVHAIERMEILTGAAGGIHGFGALGGVVNVVLNRDVDGLELHTTQGISSRSDARRRSFEASFGQTLNDGATHLMLSGSHEEVESLRVLDRTFGVRDRRRTLEVYPEYFPFIFPNGNSVAVRSWYRIDPDTYDVIINPDLTFKPEFGGQALGSNLTYLPIGFSGDNAALAAALEEHAGDVDFSVDDAQARSDLGPSPQSDSLLANIRHRFESGWETYVDAVMLRTHGESDGSPQVRIFSNGSAILEAASPANPFTDSITVNFPVVGLETGVRKRIENTRYTAGLEGGLPFDWRGTVEASWGRLRYFSSLADEVPLSGTSLYLTGDESDLDTNPLGDWNAFDRVVKADLLRSRDDVDFRSRFTAQSLRLAGPVFATRAGPATLTLLAERRSERVPPSMEVHYVDVGTPFTDESRGSPRARLTRSIYGELRSRVFDESAAVPLIRDLELQLAVRRDEQEDDFPANMVIPPDIEILHSKFTGTAYTVGAKVSPARWLMLRASYATGDQPPPIANLVELEPATYSYISYYPDPDPKRGGTALGSEGDVLLQYSGNSKLEMVRATTLFLGVVLTPGGLDGPRLALDYSRIRRTHDLTVYDFNQVIAHEDEWPERVTRAPPTDTDRANGYSVGRIEAIDVRDTNDGALEVDAFDLRAEWPLSMLDGRLRLYADATYHKSNVRKKRFEPDTQWAGYVDGPLQRRANGGFDWSRRDLTVGANLQYFGSSLVVSPDPFSLLTPEDAVLYQGSARIPSQTYLDLYGTWRIPASNLGPVDSVTLELGVVNVLDKSPPRENMYLNYGPGYSRYGDPRMRRFELGVSCHF
ncbi:MAG: TonB-dependent receptor [Pseudomonadota bacterium]